MKTTLMGAVVMALISTTIIAKLPEALGVLATLVAVETLWIAFLGLYPVLSTGVALMDAGSSR